MKKNFLYISYFHILIQCNQNNYSIVELIFLDSESLNQKINIINIDIEKSKDKEVQDLVNEYNKKVEDMLKVKEEELMSV